MAAGEEGQLNAKESAIRRANELEAELASVRDELRASRGEHTALTSKHSELTFDHGQCDGIQVSLRRTLTTLYHACTYSKRQKHSESARTSRAAETAPFYPIF